MLKPVGMAWFAREKRERISVLRPWWSRDVEHGRVGLELRLTSGACAWQGGETGRLSGAASGAGELGLFLPKIGG
jgi:hypothetical protein